MKNEIVNQRIEDKRREKRHTSNREEKCEEEEEGKLTEEFESQAFGFLPSLYLRL